MRFCPLNVICLIVYVVIGYPLTSQSTGEMSESSFESLAQKYSTCPSKSRGGSLGSFSPGTMVKEFDDVVFSPDTKVGVVMGPVQTQFGYHLITVDKRSGGGDWY